jgi:DNA-binding Lrp family transcriptional regulator
VDAVDGAILREMFRSRHLWIGGLDPRMSSGEISKRLGLDRTTVWSHLRRWQTSGFLERFDVLPNPDLFELKFGAGSLRVKDPRMKPQILRDLALVEGATGARDILGEWIVFLAASDSQAGFDRCSKLLHRLSGVDEVIPIVAFRSPPSSSRPSALDWKIIRELRTTPAPSFSRVARRLKVSLKTVTRRYQGLLRGQVVWYTPLLNYTHYTGATLAVFNMYLEPTTSPGSVVEAVERMYPNWVGLADHSDLALEPGRTVKHVVTTLQLETPAAAEDVQSELMKIPGVAEVEILFPRRILSYPDWFDRKIDGALTKLSAGADRFGP